MMTLLLWDNLSVQHFADCIYINIIGGKYIFRVKTKNPKIPKLDCIFNVLFLGGWVI